MLSTRDAEQGFYSCIRQLPVEGGGLAQEKPYICVISHLVRVLSTSQLDPERPLEYDCAVDIGLDLSLC